jgi:hypothetical protein
VSKCCSGCRPPHSRLSSDVRKKREAVPQLQSGTVRRTPAEEATHDFTNGNNPPRKSKGHKPARPSYSTQLTTNSPRYSNSTATGSSSPLTSTVSPCRSFFPRRTSVSPLTLTIPS